jgi:hypothetical protein
VLYRSKLNPFLGRNFEAYEVDPLLCTRCGQRMNLAAFLTDTFTRSLITSPPKLPALSAAPKPSPEE